MANADVTGGATRKCLAIGTEVCDDLEFRLLRAKDILDALSGFYVLIDEDEGVHNHTLSGALMGVALMIDDAHERFTSKVRGAGHV